MNKQIQLDIKMIDAGELPASMVYNINKTEYIEWNKLVFNGHIRSPDFYYKKLPKALQNIPHMYDYCIRLADDIFAETPAQQIERRRFESEHVYDCLPDMPDFEASAIGYSQQKKSEPIPYDKGYVHYSEYSNDEPCESCSS